MPDIHEDGLDKATEKTKYTVLVSLSPDQDVAFAAIKETDWERFSDGEIDTDAEDVFALMQSGIPEVHNFPDWPETVAYIQNAGGYVFDVLPCIAY